MIDRLSWWYDLPREWLKKIALMDDVYLLNNPFTFQAMEKHAAYCAMMRLGLKVPETWLLPHKLPPDNPRYVPMAERYNPDFDLDEVAERIGYPLFMKPFDGGMWVGVTRIAGPEELHAAYDESGERMMHLQASVEDFDVFTRSLSIGPQTRVMRYDPGAHGHYRYQVELDILPPELEREVAVISRLVNAFFRWEFNSCETIVKDGQAHPIDYANASPDIALVSLHYHFPWAIKSLLAWCAFCVATGRSMRLNQRTREYFEVGDDPEPDVRGEARPLCGACGRVLPGRPLRGVPRDGPPPPRRADGRVRRERGVRRPRRQGDPARGRARAAGRDDRALSEPDGSVGRGRARCGGMSRTRHVVFGTGETIAGTVYGTIVVLAALVAGASNTQGRMWHLAAVVATTSVVLWLAHVYAHALAESVSEEQPMRARRLVDVGRREATIVLAAVAPCAAVVLGALDVLKDSTALWLAVWLGVGTLAVQGLRYARIEQLGGLATLAVIGTNLTLGLLIVALKVAVG